MKSFNLLFSFFKVSPAFVKVISNTLTYLNASKDFQVLCTNSNNQISDFLQKTTGNQEQWIKKKNKVPWVADGGKLHCSLPYHELGLYELILFLLSLSHDLQVTKERLCQELWDEHMIHLPNLHLGVKKPKQTEEKIEKQLMHSAFP